MYAALGDEPPEPLEAFAGVVVCRPGRGDPQVVLVNRDGGWRVPAAALSAGKSPARVAADLVTLLTGVSCRSRPGEGGFFSVGRLHAMASLPGPPRTLLLLYGVAVPDSFALPEPSARWVALSGLTEHPETLAAVAEVLRAL